ncbi:MAG: OmpA family protein [Bdellovibrionaceae bacterium]|nr:OmpA family protein [Pseudobdellovibrionaceae bacterium]
MKDTLRSFAIVITSIFFTSQVYANIVGTDVQNFNPTTNGLDFVTVQSSETLQPGLVNIGFFLNYAANSLAYTQNVGGQVVSRKPGDRILGMDLNLGLGLTENWDVGFSLPAVLSQELKETTGVAKYDSQGLTEIRANTKYRFWGDSSRGVAAVISINNSLIQDNAFIGSGAGPTINYELVADTTIAEKFGIAANIGYRQRNPGKPIAGFPFEPFENQYIYSLAANYHIASIDTKLIGEIFASQPAEKKVNFTNNRSQETLESLIGLKHDYTPSLALHGGLGSQLQKSVASPEWRVYVGLNYVFGPLWTKKETIVAKVETPEPKKTKQFRMKGEILFEFNSAEIKPEAFEYLKIIGEDLQQNSFVHLTIEGHTDSIGNDDYNLKLSQARANSVKEHLATRYKLDSAKITPIGKGESEPISDNGNYQGRRENRRVEFLVDR